MRYRSIFVATSFVSVLIAGRATAQVDPHHHGIAWPENAPRPLADHDIRLAEDGLPAAWVNETNAELRTKAALAARAADKADLLARIPLLRIDDNPIFGTPHWVASTAQFLTPPIEGGIFEPTAVVRAFVAAHQGLFEIAAEEIDLARRSRDYATQSTGWRHLTYQQQIGGVDLFGAELRANVNRRGQLMNVSSTMLPRPEGGFSPAGVQLSAARAIRAAAGSIGASVTAEPVAVGSSAGAAQVQSWTSPDFRADRDVTTEFVYFPMSREDIRPAWRVFLPEVGVGNDYDVIVDANDGRLLWRRNQTHFLAAGGTQNLSVRVYTLDSPAPGSPGTATPNGFQFPFVPRTLVVVTPASVPQSPNSWINDGDNDTQGNNVDAHTDLDANNSPDLPRPTGAPFRVFDFPQDNAQAPSTWSAAAVTNLFYFCNLYHDKLRGFGFDEPSGNFQTDNFGLGGLGNDRVQADAQDGSGTNNANFSTPADGSSGRMQQYIFTGPTPDRDSDVDSEIVYHEYSHGLSNRLHNLALGGTQAGGMGEGWGDYFGVALNAEPTDDPNLVYTTGGYSTYLLAAGYDDNYYYGIRRFPYSTDMNKNPQTFADIDPAQQSYPPAVPRNLIIGNSASEVHNVGEVWCNMVLEGRTNLMATHGFAGNDRMMQLVVDGMKLNPGVPNFLQARDSILQADLDRYAGADLGDLWTAFAKRGCGFSATSPAGTTSSGVVEAFDLPIFFAYPAGRPTQLAPNVATTFPLEISGLGSMQPTPGTGQLFLSVNGGPFVASPLAQTSPNHYDVTLPPSDCFDTLAYYVTTATSTGSASNPTGAPASSYSATVFTGVNVFFNDNFEANQGWSATVSGATSGQWQRGIPVNDPNWAYGPTADGDGSGQCFVTQNAAGNTDVDNGSVTLTSPVFDMTGGADISYHYYLNLTDENGVDRLLVEISSNGGGAWTTIATHTTSGGQAWRTQEITAATLSGLGVAFTNNMRVRYTANDGEPQSINESGVDGFTVSLKLCDEGPASELCAGDGSSLPCPCSNEGANGNGCDNSVATGGAHLSATGAANPDTIVLTVVGERATALTVFFQGDTAIAPTQYGDGIRCVGGVLKRLYSKNASAGQASAPQGPEPSITARSAALGDPIAPGATRHYFTAYRDPDPAFCPMPTGNTFNSSNAISIVW